MSEPSPVRVETGLFRDAVDVSPDALAILDGDWNVVHLNPAGGRLLDRSPAELIGSNIWSAVPELTGTIFHSFLLHARSVGDRVTWQGYYPPADRWLTATAVLVGDLLHVYYRDASPLLPEGTAERGHRTASVDRIPDAESDRLRFLAEVSEAMIATLDTGKSAATLAQLVASRMCDWAVVTVMGVDGAPANRGRAHRSPELLADVDIYMSRRERGARDEPPLLAALLSGQPVRLTSLDPAMVEAALTTDEVRRAWQRLDPTSCTILPLRARGETFGALSMMNSAGRPPHSETEIATAVEVVRRASLALDNARLYGAQLEVAQTLQQSLLSPPPQRDGLQIAVRYRPAATNMNVGGDWYDAFAQPDGGTTLVIGDVVGHDTQAAAAMGQIRSIVRSIAYDRREDPAQILERVDEVMTGLQIDTLATALVGRLEPGEDQDGRSEWSLRWSSAGHLPPVVLRAGGTVQLLDTPPETLLGTGSLPPHSDHDAVLRPGDTLVLYTDGIVEHGRSAIDEGLARLTRGLAEFGEMEVDELCDQLLERVVTGRTDDDIALLAVRCHPVTPG
ncbi:MAG: phosphoserine phosphatase RsbU/P [Blastococcus sp.]|nr:phosphoserine phosphatase RsbU/P [Blastococcus sp.]